MANKTLPVLIKIAERRVEEVQQTLARTRLALENNAAGQVRLQQEAAVAFVNAVAEDNVMELQAAGVFQERIRREIAKMEAQRLELEEQERMQQEALHAAYGEQKRYELLLEKQKLEEKRAHDRKAQAALDEVAGNVRR
jgi:hypothetical protein